MSKTEASKPIPQGTGPAVDLLLRAIDEADVDRPVDEWLEKRISNKDQISHVKTALRFAGLLSGDRLDPKVAQWRRHPESRSRGLIRCFREGYSSVGCALEISALIGHPDLPKMAISRCLEREAPFRGIKAKGTRDNSLRFVTAFHERMVGRIRARQEASEAEPPGDEPAAKAFDAERTSVGEEAHKSDSTPMFRLENTVTTFRQPDPIRYRVARQQGDQWVYASVSFERQESLIDLLGELPPEEHVRWLDALAGALLQDADRLKQEIGRRQKSTDRLPSRP